MCVAARVIGKSPWESFTVIQHIVAEREQKVWAPIIAYMTLSLIPGPLIKQSIMDHIWGIMWGKQQKMYVIQLGDCQ